MKRVRESRAEVSHPIALFSTLITHAPRRLASFRVLTLLVHFMIPSGLRDILRLTPVHGVLEG